MSLRHAIPVPLLAIVLATAAAAGIAPVPYPPASTVPPILVGSPDGAFLSTIVVRSVFDQVMPDVPVDIYLANCSGFSICPDPCTGCTLGSLPQMLRLVTNSSGVATFNLRVGASGCPNPPTVGVYAQGVLLASPKFVSTDLDGDLSVTAADVAIANGLLGSTDLRADFDGDLVVSAADVAIVTAHLGVTCAAPVPALRRSWGTLKSIYR